MKHIYNRFSVILGILDVYIVKVHLLIGFNEILDLIFSRNSSVNFYMFHGGTNWGFMNGANVLDRLPYYAPDVTSYGKQLHTMADITYISIICNFRRSAKSISLIFSRL